LSSPALRKSRPYLFYGQTTSLCDLCHRLVPAKIRIEGDDVFYEKRCPDHGVRVAHVSSDAKYFRWQRDFLKPGDVPRQFHSRTHYGCPYDCGLCPDHEQHSCLAIVEINEACELTCPVCFAESSPQKTLHRPLATVERMFDALVAAEGEPDVVQISGGEPTLHPQFFDILRLAKSKPIRHVMINTNGLRLAQDPAFCARLAEFRVGTEVYLQFDSLRPEALKKIRGADLTRIRRQALENLERHNISTTLVCVVEKGVNDDECADIVDHALDWRCVRGVTFQPVQDAGRKLDYSLRDRALLTDIRRDIVTKSAVFGEKDLIPLPCNPGAICIGYGLRNGRQVQPVTSIFSQDDLLDAAPNAITFEKYPELQKRLFELFSLSTGPDSMVERISALLCCLPEVPVPQGLSYENVFRVNIIEFLDAQNFCIANVKRSCIHFVTENGAIIPFDTYNLFYRNGRIDGIRAALKQAGGGHVG
jgi:7,8-dihydro-6-hydroxymethylpterin dimethyltransferase